MDHSTYKAIKADVWRYYGRYSPLLIIKSFLLYRTFRPVFTLRLCQAAQKLPFPMKAAISPLVVILHRWTQAGAGLDLPWRCSIGPGFRITHGWGLVIHDDAIIGSNVTIFHGVTIGSKRKGDILVSPTIGDSVTLATGAIVIGEVRVGEGSIVGAGAVVVKDVPPFSIVANTPCTQIASGIEPRVSFCAPLN